MNPSTSKTIIALLVVALIIVAILGYRRQKEIKSGTCFDLPTESDPSKFGPAYWKAFHTLAEKVPCGACKGFAVKFMVFFHDLVNLKLNKPIQDQANFDYFLTVFSDLKAGKGLPNSSAH